MSKISEMIAASGRMRKEDDSVVNIANLTESIYNTVKGILDERKAVLVVESLAQVVPKGTNNYLIGDVTNYKDKTIQIYSDNPGYCGIDVEIGEQWRSLSSSQNIIFQDPFTGADGDALASAWEVSKVGTYTDADTYAKIYANKMRMTVSGTAGVPKIQTVMNKPMYLSREYVAKFILDETLFDSAHTSREFKMGISPSKPATGGTEVFGLTGAAYIMWIYGGSIYKAGGVKVVNAPELSSSQEYTVVLTATKLLVYRGTTLIIDSIVAFDQTQYYLAFQGMCGYATSPLTFTIDTFSLYNRDVTAKVLGNTLYTKTIADAVLGNIRVNFMADFGADALADIRIIGRS